MMLISQGRQHRFHRSSRIRQNFHLQIVKPGGIQGNKLRLCLFFHGNQVHALFFQFIKATAHRTAGPGAQGIARPERAGFMHMAQSDVIQAGGRHLGLGDGIIRRFFLGRIAVQHGNVELFIAFLRKILQQRAAIHGCKSCAVDPAVQAGHGNALDGVFLENMDIFRPAFPQPGAVRAAKIMVSGGNKHRHGRCGQGAAQSIHAVHGPIAVKQVTGKQHQITAMGPAKLCQQPRQAQLGPAQCGNCIGTAAHKG